MKHFRIIVMEDLTAEKKLINYEISEADDAEKDRAMCTRIRDKSRN